MNQSPITPLLLGNYAKIAVRHLWRYKGYTAINILGLAIGMACGILIIFYVQDELSFDRYHDKGDQIYRVVNGNNAKTASAVGPALTEEFAQVTDYVRMRPPFGYWMMRFEDKSFYEDLVYWTDGSVFDIFSFELVRGNPETALKEPYTGVITETIARKYFGDEDPIGKVIRADELFDVKVTGIIKDLPSNAHFQVDFMVSAISLNQEWGENALSDWFDDGWYTYVILASGTSPEQVAEGLAAFVTKHVAQVQNAAGGSFDLKLQALTDIHLYSHLENEAGANSNVVYIYLLIAIAVFVITIAGINFMNLATARSAGRAREVGLRKVVGAYRRHLTVQFIGESVFLAVIAAGLATLMVYLILPEFNELAGKELTFQLDKPTVWFGLLAMAFIVGIFAGSYPALYLSSFQPVMVLKGQQKTGAGKEWLRKGLVIIQFAISIVLIIGSYLLYEQFSFVQNKAMGLQKEQVLVLTGGFAALYGTHEPLKAALREDSRIINMSGIAAMPGRSGRKGAVPTASIYIPTGGSQESIDVQLTWVSYDIIETLGFDLAAGRGHSRDFQSDSTAFILNETASKRLGWNTPQDAIGQPFTFTDGFKATVVGVVRDFHMRSLHQQIQPLVMGLFDRESTYLGIRMQPGNAGATIGFIEQTWRKILPDFPFAYTFLEEDFARLYQAEEKLSGVFNIFTGITIFIACLGLFGLVSFTAEQRTKEIGVRKVIGASVPEVIILLSKDFLKLVLAANVIAWPVAYLAMSRWLQTFAYRIDIPWHIFLLGGFLTLIIAMVTVSYQAVRAAMINPIEALREE